MSAQAKKAYVYKNGEREVLTYPKPARLSKAGEWKRDHPEGLGLVVHDWRAVMR